MRCNDRGTLTIYVLVTFMACSVLVWAGTCSAQTFISFDAPGAGTGSGQGTFPVVITRNGFIGGIVSDNNSIWHAFVRLANGKFTTIVPPNSTYTSLSGLNWHGQVAGWFADASFKTHGYLRNGDGGYVQLDVPGATGGTSVAGINGNGQVVGNFFGASGQQAFFWDAANPNNYVVFTVPGSSATMGVAINDNGEIAGSYQDSGGSHGYVRTLSGTITTFDFGAQTTMSVAAINTRGQVVGDESFEGVDSGFLRAPSGKLTFWGTQSHVAFQPASISDTGVIVGTESSEGGSNAAFERDSAGNITFIAVPFSNTATSANGVNRSGQVTGTYTDSAGLSHGWVN